LTANGESDIFNCFRGLIFLWLCRDEGIGSAEKRQPSWASEEQSAQDKIYHAAAWYAWSSGPEEAEHHQPAARKEAPDCCMGGTMDKRRGRHSKGGYRPFPAGQRQHTYQNLALTRIYPEQQHCCSWAQSYGQTFEGILGGSSAAGYSK
jgi:hypothetical protein